MSKLQKLRLRLKPSNLLTPMQWAAPALLCCILCISNFAYAENPARIVKWKDEKGVTHYGDKIPPQYANRENSLINKQGITVQQNKPDAPQDKAGDLAKQEQEKKDRALLGTFTNADEIDLTRDRNLEPDLLALKNLQQDKAAAQKKLDKTSAAVAGYTQSKKPIPANLSDELKANKAEVAKIDQRINERQQAIDGIRKRFDEDKKRYLQLRNQGSTIQNSGPPVQVAPATGTKNK